MLRYLNKLHLVKYYGHCHVLRHGNLKLPTHIHNVQNKLIFQNNDQI